MRKPKKPLVEFYKDKKGEHRWRAIARNGRILADSGEGYKRRSACVKGAYAALDAITVGLVALESGAGK